MAKLRTAGGRGAFQAADSSPAPIYGEGGGPFADFMTNFGGMSDPGGGSGGTRTNRENVTPRDSGGNTEASMAKKKLQKVTAGQSPAATPTPEAPPAGGGGPFADLIQAMTPPKLDYASMFKGGKPQFDKILEGVGQSTEWAQQANMARLQDILGGFENMGQAGEARIGQQQQQQVGKATSDMVSRGVYNTTMGPNIERSIASDAEMQRQMLQEGIQSQRAGVLERMNTTGPDMGMLSQLMGMASGSTAGAGAAGGAGPIKAGQAGYREQQGGAPKQTITRGSWGGASSPMLGQFTGR